MVMYQTARTLFTGLIGLSVTFIVLSFAEQTIWDNISPILTANGMSMLGAQMIDANFYGVDALMIIGIIGLVLSAIVWVAGNS